MDGSVPVQLYLWNLIYASALTVLHDKLYVTIGNDIELQCPFRSTINPTIWRGPPNFSVFSHQTKIRGSLKHAERLAISGRHHIGEFNLKIFNFTASDEGVYRCTSISDKVAVQKDFSVHQYISPYNIEVTDVQREGYLETIHGKNVTLNCSVKSGNPEEVIRWNINETILAVGGPAALSVTFTADRHDHMKFLSCVAQNSNHNEPITFTFQLHVKYIPTVWIEGEHHIKRSEGDILTITCHYDSGNENAKVKWIHSNKTDIRGMYNVSEKCSYLTVFNLSRDLTGTFECQVENEIGTGSDVVFLKVRYSPVLHYNFGIPTVLKTEKERPANISFVVESFETPVVLWSRTSGGRVNIWIKQSLNKIESYMITLTITPYNHSHFGNYFLRIQNSEGNVKVTFLLAYEELHIQAFPTYTVYQTYETVAIKCTINPKRYINWTFSVKHYWNGIYIRTLNAVMTGNLTEISMSYCDYTDTGIYVCSLHTYDANFEASSTVLVKGPPIISRKNISLSHGEVVLSVYAYCFPWSDLSVNWVHDMDGKSKPVDLLTLNATTGIKPSAVTLFSYGIPVIVDGFVINITFKVIPTTPGNFVCHIINGFKSKEASFELSTVALAIKAIQEGLFTTSTETLPKNSESQSHVSILYICVSVSGFVVVIISAVILIVLWKRKRRQIGIKKRRS